MQESNPKKHSGSLSVQTGARLPSPSQNLLSQFYSFDEEKTPKVDRSEPSIRSPASATQAKDIQVQLEINQSKLNSLAKKIDQCLSASKTTYTTAQVMQPSESSLETSSLEENKEVKAPEQAIQDFKPEEQNEEANLSPNVSNGIMKSYRASMDTTTEEIVMSLGVSKKSVENLKKNNVQQKEKIAPNSSPAPKPTQTPQKANSKAPVQKTTRPSSTQKPAGSLQSSDIQKKLDTVSSVMIETGEDVPVLPKGKEKVPPLKPERRANNYSTSSKTPQKEEGSLSARSRPEKPDIKPGVAKKTSPQPRHTVSQTKVPASSVAEVEKTKTNTNLDKQNEHKVAPKIIGKTLSPVKTEPKAQPVNKQTPKNTAVSAEKKTNIINEDKKTAPVIKPKAARPSVPATKNEPLKKASVPVVAQEKLQPSSSRKSTGVMRFPEECIVGDLEAIRMISPVSHDTKSSKGIYDFSTPGYNFDSPQHNNPNNLSINDSKNLSFESSLFGKDTSAAKMDNLQVRRKSGFSTEQNKPKEALKRNNSVKHEKLTTDEDLEANFTKAFTARKNRVINDLPDFESRLDSDLYYRRRFRVDLQNFLDENKSKLTEEQTERLIDRLVEDGNRRKVKAQKVELYNEKGYKESKNSTPAMSEDRLNQTFERLVSDAKKRLLLQEEQERIKALKQQEMDKKIERERSQKKMSKESEEKMVSKFVAEADRRRIQYEKTQIAKQEEEIRQANELQAQGFKPKSSNKAKSKIKEYINSKTETSLELSERRNRSQKSILKDDKSRTPSPVEIMPTIQEKPLTTDRKPVTPKKKYLSIPSPKGKAVEAFKKISKESPKNNSISSLEHLQTLRKNINKHKNEIEEHLYNLKEIDTDSPVRTLTTSPERNPQFVSKRPEAIKTASPKKDKDSTLSTKVTSKYDHIESKVAKHIETKYVKQQDQSLADEKSKETRELPRTSLTSPKTLNNTKEGLVKQAKNEKEEIKSKGHSHNQSKFMSDRAAMSFVEKLINEFKMSKNT